jgi:sulfopropanediol 3-dehydrogenase
MSMAGADEIYLLGGVQAVVALSLGTETIDRVNLTRVLARMWRRRNGTVRRGRHRPVRGPTEILVIADEHADPFVVAVDLLSQAEHGPDSPAVLVTTSDDRPPGDGAHRPDPRRHAHLRHGRTGRGGTTGR